MKREDTVWPEFLSRVNEEGLDPDDLLIGLKAKEREINHKGRYFSFMFWMLREYFVFTEYLIKTKIVPLFHGLTMADDQITLIKKLIQNSAGQGGLMYAEIGVANHLDYEKWNNHQRKEATDPVFRVIGQFFGLPNLFVRTHEFFEKSLIYYIDRPDLMEVVDGKVQNKGGNLVCWDGQAGGFEGLRQKGWSVLNLLVIEREAKIRNTKIKILAQGDNQVICTQYKIRDHRNSNELRKNIKDIVQNNSIIMKAIEVGTNKLGLLINKDETLQSADLLIYGEIVLYRGHIMCLPEKRYSRITCTTNDQLPNMGNTLATAGTNSLTVSHYSKSPLNAMYHYNWVGNLVRRIIEIHNPALRCAPEKVLHDVQMLNNRYYKMSFLYMDPSFGGIGGMSLTRFHVRQFPDPVTESLSFWKIVYENTSDDNLRRYCLRIGSPRLAIYVQRQFAKLLEDPTSLNIPRGISADTVLKEEIRRSLIQNVHRRHHPM